MGAIRLRQEFRSTHTDIADVDMPQERNVEPIAPGAAPGRAWNWILAGCLGCLVLVVVVSALAAAIVYLAFSVGRSSPVYLEALERARSHPAVIERLGEPIVEGWWIIGSVHVSGADGEADLAIPISGPNGAGTIYLSAEKRSGAWQFDNLDVTFDGVDGRIDLLDKGV